MAKLTPEGERIVAALAEQYKIGADAVKIMLDAVSKGGGAMAEFNVPELGGSGQWMRGGMTMIGDMLNNSMKATVDNLCTELSNLTAAQASIFAPMAQSPSQSSGSEGASASVRQLYNWWPEELGNPSSTGSQNALRYACFPEARRLAIDFGHTVEVYDTTGFTISGFAQQQQGGDAASLALMSNRGPVRLDRLPRVHGLSTGKKGPERKEAGANGPAPEAPVKQKPASGDAGSILALIEQLGGLKEKGILTEEEFAAKKAELLKRL